MNKTPLDHIIFLGGGNMAQAMLAGLAKTGLPRERITVIDPSAEAQQTLIQQGYTCLAQWPDHLVLSSSSVVFLAVKPQQMAPALKAIGAKCQQSLIISIAAGISLQRLSSWLEQPDTQSPRLVRAMPNTPALVGEGMTGFLMGEGCTNADAELTRSLLSAFGQAVQVPTEQDIDAITAISGSGPGYVFYWMNALQAAAEAQGFSAETARLLVNQTFLGAAKLASSSQETLAKLQQNVTSKGGTTEAGLKVMQTAQSEETILSATQAAFQRAKQLSEGIN